jgi:hypothetical protein
MKSELILEKLATFDPSNKEFWNQDGQPRLSAIGEGVKREDVLAVAPLFSRENPVLAQTEKEPELTDEEVVQVIQDKATELESRKQEASAALVRANAMRIESEELRKQANQVLESIKDEQKALDPRTEAEINKDLLKASFAERLRRHGAQSQAKSLLEQAGLGHEARAFTVSPIDRAIAERVVHERRKRMAPKK